MPNSPLIDLAVRRQVLLERVKAGQIKDFQKAFGEIQGIVRSAFIQFDGKQLTQANKRQLNSFLLLLRKDVTEAFNKHLSLYTVQLDKTAGLYAAAEAFDISKSVVGTPALKVPKGVYAKARSRPMSHSGELLDDFIGGFAGKSAGRIQNLLRQGYVQGRRNDQMIDSVIGTKAHKFRDGILDIEKSHAESMIRTATQHVASSARTDVWEANNVEKYQWISTLDQSTTQICRSLDGQEFPVGKGPLPPIHIRCRSTHIAVLSDKYKFLSEGRTRSAEFGPVDAKENYYDWLKEQKGSVQVEALGRDRAKLFKDGGLTSEEFRKLGYDKNFKPLTLEQMRDLEPEAFKAAGV